jgi:hypothetical protein
MSALTEELLASFFVNEARNWVGKKTSLRIFRRATTNRIALNHPSASEPQYAV